MKNCNTNYPIDLHCHTTRSDGSDTPKELIEHAAELGMKVIAITDHDIRPPEQIEGVETVAYAAEKGVGLLKGIEISCETTVEDCHIVCFGCDWNVPYFDKLEQQIVESKIESYKALVTALQKAGYQITWQEVLENGGQPVSEEHVQKKMIFELLSRKEYFPSWSDAKSMVKSSPDFSIPRRKPDAQDVIREIHASGGIAILAHPYLIADKVRKDGKEMSRDEFIQSLTDCGLDGIEARYTYGKTSYTGCMSEADIADEVYRNYGKTVRLISGGSDYHADEKKGVANPRQLGDCGLTEEEFVKNSVLTELLNENKGM